MVDLLDYFHSVFELKMRKGGKKAGKRKLEMAGNGGEKKKADAGKGW